MGDKIQPFFCIYNLIWSCYKATEVWDSHITLVSPKVIKVYFWFNSVSLLSCNWRKAWWWVRLPVSVHFGRDRVQPGQIHSLSHRWHVWKDNTQIYMNESESHPNYIFESLRKTTIDTWITWKHHQLASNTDSFLGLGEGEVRPGLHAS